jgi:hypothetical protein
VHSVRQASNDEHSEQRERDAMQRPLEHDPATSRFAPDATLSTEAARKSSGYRLGRLLGVEVVADISLLIIFALVTFNLGAGLFPRWRPDWSVAMTWVYAADSV